MPRNRISWVDTTKGMLILLVVMGHIPVIMRMHFSENIDIVSYYDIPHCYIRSFFMQAFFFLTGFTSSFNKPMNEFLGNILKSMLLPYITLSLYSKILGVLFLGESLWHEQEGEMTFFLLENFWFIHALILSKLLYYILDKYLYNKYLMGGVFLLLIVVSVLLNSYYNTYHMNSHYHNLLHYRNGFAMAFFLWVGAMFKGKDISNKLLLVGSAIFCVMFVISFANKYIFRLLEGIRILSFLSIFPHPVHYTHNPDFFNVRQVSVYIIYALTGTCFIVLLSKLLDKTKYKIFDYLGNNSLVIYCTHFVFMGIFIDLLYPLITPIGYCSSALYFLLVLCTTLICSVASIELFKLKPLKFLLGKF